MTIRIENPFDGKTAKVGDPVWSTIFGSGVIISNGISIQETLLINIKFNAIKFTVSYFADGKYHPDQLYPDLFHGPFDLVGPAKPKKRKAKVRVRVFQNIYPYDHVSHHLTRAEADEQGGEDRIDCVELTGERWVEVD